MGVCVLCTCAVHKNINLNVKFVLYSVDVEYLFENERSLRACQFMFKDAFAILC